MLLAASLSVDFLERHIRIAVAALVFFKIYTSREGNEARTRRDQDRAKIEMFERAHEKQEVGRALSEDHSSDSR